MPSLNRFESIEQSKMFDFDPDAIQLMEDVELQQLPEAVNREIVKNSQDIVYEEEDVEKEEARVLERKLFRRDKETSDNVKNSQLYEQEDLPLIQENRRDIRHQIRHIVHDPEMSETCSEKRLKLHDRRYQLITPSRQDQKFAQENIFANRKQKVSKEHNFSEKQYRLRAFNRSLSVGDPFVTDDRRSFRESRENAINNIKNVKIMEAGEKSFRKIGKYFLMPLDHSNGNQMFRKRLHYDLPGENGVNQTKVTLEHDRVSFENERITRKTPLNSLAKIMTQRRLHPNDIHFPVSPVSPESGFCEGSPDINPRRPQLFANVLKGNAILQGRQNSSCSESNLSRKNTRGDFSPFTISERCVEDHVVKTPINISNNIRDVDKNNKRIIRYSSDSDLLPHGHAVNDDSDLVKCCKVVEEPHLSDRTEPNVLSIDESKSLLRNNSKEAIGKMTMFRQ